jgi:hypothetical protein
MATYKDKPDWSLATNGANVLLRSISCNHYEFAQLSDGKYYGAEGELIAEIWHVVEHKRHFEKNDDKAIKVSANKYERDISDRQGNKACVDVYDVIAAFEVTCPAIQHALKKLLCTGSRGHKDAAQDLIEASNSITRAIELLGSK